jgi:ABC-type uncharacterized transport system substrate-binding protein
MVAIQPIEVGEPGEFDKALSAWAATQAGGFVMQDHGFLLANSDMIAALAVRHRLASIGPLELLASGGLFGYGVKFSDFFRRAAYFVDKVLMGTKPGDIPIEQATKFKFDCQPEDREDARHRYAHFHFAARRQGDRMRRREFITLISGATAAWPLATRAQQPDRMQRIGVLMAFDENDPNPKSWLSGFTKALAELGWTDGRNLSMNARWAAGNADRMRMFAKELVDLQLDVILANSTPVTASLQRETQTIPIVFVAVSDPVGSGFVAGLARPGGNITGFADAETAMMGKWLELLTAIAPGVKRIAAKK